jgi:uncharacterized protein
MPVDTQTVVALIVALLATGLAAGLLAGLLGVGGGIVMVPVMYYVFGFIEGIDVDVKMHMAVGTSLATMIPTSIRSALAHHRKGSVDWALFKRWLPGMVVGVATGAALASFVGGGVLIAVFATFAIVVGLHMAFGKESWRIASKLPGRIGQSVMAYFIASISVMMGIGGGTFTVPTLTLFGYPIHKAVGTAAAVGVLIAVPGAIAFVTSGLGVEGRPPWSLGYTSLIGVAVMVPMSILAAPWGVALAHRLDRRWLRRAFALFLGATGLRMAVELFT